MLCTSTDSLSKGGCPLCLGKNTERAIFFLEVVRSLVDLGVSLPAFIRLCCKSAIRFSKMSTYSRAESEVHEEP